MGKDRTDRTLKGKDTNGTFHPGKGKPSGANKEEGLGLHPTDPEKLEEYLAMTDKYTEGEDVLASNVPLRHPNRHPSKADDNGRERNGGNANNNGNAATDEGSDVVIEQLPGVLTKERFAELANYKADCTISIYIPTNGTGVEGNEQMSKIDFKSLLNTVEQQLKERGHTSAKIENLLKPGYELINDQNFLRNLTAGLALFIADCFFKYIKMPVAAEQQVVIEPTFYVTPLVPVLTRSEYFYVLVVTKSQLKLFKADAFGIQPVPVDVPGEAGEVKRLSDLDATTYRTGSAGKRATPVAETASYHGHGGGNPDEKEILATYFEYVDDILFKSVFNKENAPLVLAGVEYLLPIYKSVCDYHNVWDKWLTGNRERQDTATLYQEAKELMEPYFMQKQNKALEMFGNKSATELTSSIIDDVIPATYYGRVSHLFVCKGCQVWGSFDEMDNKLTLHETQQADSEELLDHAVMKTLATGGEVYVLDKEHMPADSMVAALLRY
ncbi:hypothetical protein [Aridibaculum aurantiacum]|uniref:baeRF7 domain-containing protein n=1 Tax=Aridibaculum aurantiacum TaxID=2810307 RepID=UPI001A9758D2|nr:hypothetical protein [Aridibaculum aurantiacum]